MPFIILQQKLTQVPQVQIDSPNISQFGFSTTFDILNRVVVFDISQLTIFKSGGALNVQGICFSLQDSSGIVLLSYNWTSPQIPHPSTDNEPVYMGESTFTLDLSSVNYPFLFQDYIIQGAIKDQDGTIYQTTPMVETVSKPPLFLSTGYSQGAFTITPNCQTNALTVTEITPLFYQNTIPTSKVVSGELYYPVGTISPVPFTFTPFVNNSVVSGEFRIVNTTTATYLVGTDTYVLVSYYTNQPYDVTCNNAVQSVICCILQQQEIYKANCNNAIGQNAYQKLQQITVPLAIAQALESIGQDASSQIKIMQDILNCNCNNQNQFY